MLKQGVKTTNADVIQTRALSQLSFIKFTPYANSFPGLLLSLTLMLKSKKTLETSLDLILVRYLILNLHWGEGEPPTKFSKKKGEGEGGLTGSQFLERGYWGRGGGNQ